MQEIWVVPTQIAESDPSVMVCMDLVGLFEIRTTAKHISTLSACTHNDRSSHWLV
jgi:hypothetical protein